MSRDTNVAEAGQISHCRTVLKDETKQKKYVFVDYSTDCEFGTPSLRKTPGNPGPLLGRTPARTKIVSTASVLSCALTASRQMHRDAARNMAVAAKTAIRDGIGHLVSRKEEQAGFRITQLLFRSRDTRNSSTFAGISHPAVSNKSSTGQYFDASASALSACRKTTCVAEFLQNPQYGPRSDLERSDNGNRSQVVVERIRAHDATTHPALANPTIGHPVNNHVVGVDPAVPGSERFGNPRTACQVFGPDAVTQPYSVSLAR